MILSELFPWVSLLSEYRLPRFLKTQPARVPFPSRWIARAERWTRKSIPMDSSRFHPFTWTGRGGGYTGRNEDGGLPQACMAFHGGVRLGFSASFPLNMDRNRTEKTPFRGTKRGLVRGCGMARRAARLYLFIPLIVGDGDGRTPWHAITCLIHALPSNLYTRPSPPPVRVARRLTRQGASNLPIIRTE